MNRILLSTLAGVVLTGLSLGQSASQSPVRGATTQGSSPSQTETSPTPSSSNTPAETERSSIAPGSILPGELTKSLDAKKAKPGEQVVLKVPGELRSNNGEVAVPPGAKIVGHVTEAKARENGEAESTLAMAFDKLVLKDGREIPLTGATIQALAPPQSTMGGNNEPMSESGGMPGAGPGQRPGGVGGVGRAGGTAPSTGGYPTGTSGDTHPAGGASGVRLTPTSQGVLGMQGLSLSAAPDGQGSVISSQRKNVKLDSGTQILLRTGNK